MKKTTLQILGALAVVALSTLSSSAASTYWDINGATAGAGGATPSGNWDTTTANWSADSTGASATAAWSSGNSAIFSAGTDATGNYTVTVSSVTASNITQNLGRPHFVSGTITLAGATNYYTATTRVSGDYDMRFDSDVAGTGSIVVNGPGIVHFNGNKSFSGGITLNSGSLALENTTAGLGTGAITLAGGNFVRNWNTVTVTNPINCIGTVDAIIYQNNPNFNITGPWLAGSTSGNFCVSNITVNGFGPQSATIFISGDISAYTGTFSQTSGNNRLRFGPSSGSGQITLNGSNAKFATYGSTSSGNMLDLADNYYGTFQMGELSGSGGWIHAGWATGGNTTFQIGALNTSTTYAGNIADNPRSPGGLAAVTKVGTGSLTFTGPNSYSQATTIENGALIAGANVSVSAAGPFGNSSTAILLGDANSETANQNVSLFVGGAFTMARQVTVGAGNATTATFTLGGNTPNSATFSGNITLNQNLVVTQAVGGTLNISGTISGSSALTKTGGGTVTLSGVNSSYSGNVAVNSGTLLVSAQQSGGMGGAATVADGATLGVNASADALYLAPGSLTVGSSTGGSLQFAVVGTTTPPLQPGALTLNGTTTIKIANAPVVNGASYPLFSGYTSGTLALGSQPGGLFGQLVVSGGTVFYQVTNIAPNTWTAKVNTNWDTTTANWTNSLGGNLFAQNSPAQFDDTATGTSPLLVNVTAASVSPVSISVNNTTKSYVIGGNPIAGAASLTKTGNNTLSLTGSNTFTGNLTISAGSLEISGAGYLGGGNYSGAIDDETTLKINSTSAQTLAGAISGNGALIKASTGTLTVSAANTSYYGGTTVSNGTLLVANDYALGYGNVTLAGGTFGFSSASTVNFANSVNVTGATILQVASGINEMLNGSFSGTGNLELVQNGNVGQWVFAGDNSGFSGTFTEDAGNTSLRFDSSTSGSANAAWAFNNSTVERTRFNFGTGTISFGSLSGNGSLANVGYSGSVATVEVGGLNTGTTFSGTLNNGLSGGISALTKVGTGTLTLSGACAYTGPTTVNAGTLMVSALMTGASDYTVADGATLGVKTANGGGLVMNSLTLGNGVGCTNLFININSLTNVVVTNIGALTLNGEITISVQGNFSVGQYALIGSAGGITGTGGFVVGTLPPGAAATIITNGDTIFLNVTAAPSPQLWTGTSSGNWDFTSSNWSQGASPSLYTDSLGATFDDSSSRTNVTLTTNVSPLVMLVTNNTRNYTLTGTGGAKITGAVAFTKTGNGKLTLAGLTNDFTGQFTVGGGTVVVDGNAALGAGTVSLNGGALSPSQSFTLSKTVVVGPATGSGTGGINVDSGLTLTNNTAMSDNGSGSGTLVKTGSGTLLLGASSTYTGGTVVSNGTLVLANGGAIGPVRGTLTIASGGTVNLTTVDALGFNNDATRVSVVNVNGGTLNNSTAGNQGYRTLLNLTGGTVISSGGGAFNFTTGQTISSLASSTMSSITAPIQLRDTATLPFDVAAGSVPGGIDLTVSGVIVEQFAGSSILKLGAGKLVLSNSNTYTGTTTVSNGTLLVNGSIASAVAVNGGTFGGTGVVSNSVTVNAGGTLSPGASIGTLTVNGNLTLAGNTLIELNKSLSPAQSNDFVNVTGTLTYGGTLTVTNLGPALAAGNSFRVFPSGGTGSVTVVGNAGSGLQFSFSDGVVSVVTAGPSGPGTITNSITGSTLNLTWPAGQGWRLESQTNNLSTGLSATGWGTVPGVSDGSAAISIDRTKPTVFYRLVYP